MYVVSRQFSVLYIICICTCAVNSRAMMWRISNVAVMQRGDDMDATIDSPMRSSKIHFYTRMLSRSPGLISRHSIG